jgi:CTP synthase (UTP-ammonia lyase)
MTSTPKLILLGEYDPAHPLHTATSAAIEHSCTLKSIAIDYRWVSTADIKSTDLQNIDGLWVAPGGPYKISLQLSTRSASFASREYRVWAPAADFST